MTDQNTGAPPSPVAPAGLSSHPARRGAKFDWWRLLPTYWVQNRRTCWEWDQALNEAMDRFPVKKLSEQVVTIGPLSVWGENWPYAYGTPYPEDDAFGYVLPSVATRKRLRAAVCSPEELRRQARKAQIFAAIRKGNPDA